MHDACEAEALIEDIPHGATLLGDKGYDSNAIRQAAEARNIWANIPNRSNRKQPFASRPGFTVSATWLNASSIASSSSGALQRAMTTTRPITLQQSNSFP